MERSERTRGRLTEYARAYPSLEIVDLFKYVYQSAFGCEHLVSSQQDIAEKLCLESSVRVGNESPREVEQLDGPFRRVPLSYLDRGLTPETLGRIFSLSAKAPRGGEEALLSKLACVREITREGAFPFSPAEFEGALSLWQAEGFPAIRHSDSFREAYHPSYRVIADDYARILPLLCEIDKRMRTGRVILAVEGGSASGKTTLARALQEIYDCNVFHMDEFFLRPEQRTAERLSEVGGNLDRERFLSEVLLPLSRGETVRYRLFDCSTMTLGAPVTVTPTRLTVVEGAYSMHPELAPYYDLSLFLKIDSICQRKRIEKRNSAPLAERFFGEWIPMENRYFSQMKIQEHCDLTITIDFEEDEIE